jgi:hypothetical protein
MDPFPALLFSHYLSAPTTPDCTYSHFNSSSNCPVCNKVLSERDFMELVVADPPSTGAPANSKTSVFQNLFTKQNGKTRVMSFQDLCARTLRLQDDTRAGSKFLMKQFLIETSKQSQRFSQILRALEGLKQEFTTLKQTHNTSKIRYESVIEKLQTQLSSAQKKLEDKDRQLYQFRKIHDTMTPESPSKHPHPPLGGEQSRRVSNGSSSHVVPGSRQHAPPMPGFMIQKEEQERARHRAIEQGSARPPILGHLHQQAQRNPYHRPMFGSQGSGGSGGFHHGNKRPRAMSPSQAFGMQPPGSYSASRGPVNFFQQGGSNGVESDLGYSALR